MTQTQDFAVAGLRLLLLVIVSAFLLDANTTNTALRTPLIVAVFANVVLIIAAFIPWASPHTMWIVIVGDVLTAGVFANILYSNPPVALLFLSGIVFLSLVRLDLLLGVLNVGAVIGVFVAMAAYNAALRGPAVPYNEYWLPFCLMAFVSVGLGTLLNLRDEQVRQRTSDIRSQAQQRLALVKNMQQRTIAITEMAHLLSSTLNYQRVLDAALNVGQLALHDKSSASFVAMVLLYRPEDNMLYIETARGISRHDENRLISGRSGIVGDTLRICEPMFAGSVRKDPELKQFLTLQNVRSVVTVPLRAGYDNYGVMLFASQTPFAFDERNHMFLEAIGIQTTIALQNAVLYQGLADEKERIVEVEEEARRKLARDLHDGPTQAISAIAMRLSMLQHMVETNPKKVITELSKMDHLARKTTSEIRSMMFTLRPLALENKGLNAALTQLAEKMGDIYEQQVDVMVSEAAERILTQHQSGALFYIVEEAVNNARKHARADVINVRVTRYDDVLLVEISDDGVGFDLEVVTANYEGQTSLGMVNLRDRTELIDGNLTIETAPGKGTTISVVVPVDPTGTRFAQPSSAKVAEEKQDERFRLTPIR